MTQVLVECIVTGSLYTLIALGLSLIFGVMRVINFAHAQMYMAGAYAIYLLYGKAHIAYGLALVLTAVTVGTLGVVIERVIIRPVHQDPERAMIATLGLLLVLEGVALVIFGANGQYVQSPVNGSINVFGSPVAADQALAGVVALLLLASMFVGLRITKMGRAMRALAQDQIGARLQGVRVNEVRAAGFWLGSALAALAGGLILPFSSATPDMGNDIILKMFIILVLGGLGSTGGVAIGAFILAFLETVGVTYIGQYAELFVYVLVIAILITRPQGILGRRAIS